MTDKSELDVERTHYATTQLGLSDQGDIDNAMFSFKRGALWLLEQLFEYQKEQQGYTIHLPGQHDRLIGIGDIIKKAKELCGK